MVTKMASPARQKGKIIKNPPPMPPRRPLEKEGEIKVHRLVVHKLVKLEGEKTAQIDPSARSIRINKQARDLVNALNESFSNCAITYAAFDYSQTVDFPQKFRDYINNPEGHSFVNFTKSSVEDLYNIIKEIPLAKGGYLVFADYVFAWSHFFSVYLIRDTTGLFFVKDKIEDSYTINELLHLDLTRLAMACRIDVDLYKIAMENLKKALDQGGFTSDVPSEKYLSAISRENDISKYFLNWIGATNRANSKAFTHEFISMIYDIQHPLEDGGKEMSKEKFRNLIHDFVNSRSDKMVDLQEIGEHFYQNRTILTDYISTQKINLNTQFRADPAVLKKLINVILNSDGIEIRFSKFDFSSNKVTVVGNQVIINSKKLADDILDAVK